MTVRLQAPWLVAAWPGMGGVAHLAAAYLIDSLAAEPLAEIPPGTHFERRSVRIRAGVLQPLPNVAGRFYGWHDPKGRRDLAMFVGPEQPSAGAEGYCNELLATARGLGVQRIVTFAAMASPIRPDAEPRVLAVATGSELLAEARRAGAVVLDDGEIAGMNGVFLAEAAAHGFEGLCLLGEFPYFAAAMANPKASAAVLRVLSALTGVEVDRAGLERDAEKVESLMLELLERLQRTAELESADEPAERPPRTEEASRAKKEQKRALPPGVETRIERLFGLAAQDRGAALRLKAELDRHGVFAAYEDRFLDLFKQAE
jgi:proteasome assembly chaperone (PAC2) family protein